MVDTNYHSESIHLTLHTQGFMLFDTHSSVEHLAMMEVVKLSWNRYLLVKNTILTSESAGPASSQDGRAIQT